MATPAHHRWTRYLAVWMALVGLTALSFLLSLAHLGALDTVVSLVIAAAKSTIVLLFFMHLVEERFTIAVVPALAVGYVALLVALMVTDVMSRRTFPRTPLRFGDDPSAEPGALDPP